MSEYRIEKLKRQVIVLLNDGSTLEGEIFLRPLSRYRPRPEEPLELLNDVEPYFPLLVGPAEAVILSKSGVASFETSLEEGEDQEFTALGLPVEVTMINGMKCTGSVFIESRPGRQRLFDFLNAFPSRFLPVVDARRIRLINTQSIAHVREVV